MRDLYSVLGVKRDAAADEIKAAWRTKAKSIHPDQNREDPNATKRFAEIGRAYEVLKDPAKRNRYDEQRSKVEAMQRENTIMQQRQAAQEAAERAKAAKANAERVMAELAEAEAAKAKADKAAAAEKAAAEKAKAAKTAAANGAAANANGQANPDGKSGGKANAKSEKPEDVVSRIFGETAEAQAAADALRQDGSKEDEHAEAREAAAARGLAPLELLSYFVRRIRGVQPPPEKAPDLFVETMVAIDDLLNELSVLTTLPDGRDVRVTLQSGLTEGSTVRLKGQGLKVPGMTRGDVVVTIRVVKSDTFTIDGFDIKTVLPITLENAVLGCETTVETPTGPIEITVPAWSGSDHVLTVDDQGLHNGEGGRGALKVELRVILWEKPDEKVTDLMRIMREGLYL